MDHLPAVANPLPPIEVPFVAVDEYDGGNFADYPERKGLKSGDIRMSVWKDEAQAGPFLQTWLFFGLMSAFFGVGVKTEDFLREGPAGGKYVNSSALVGYMQDWEARSRAVPADEVKAYYKRQTGCIDLAYQYNRTPGNPNPVWAVVSQSISILIQNLTDISVILLNRSAEPGDPDDVEVFRTRDYNHIEQPYLEKIMLECGWCPHEVARIRSKDLPCTTVYFLGRMRRDFRGKTHKGCSEAHCGVYDIDESSYETQHTDAGCPCDHVSPPVKKLRTILREGGIPIVECTISPMNELEDLNAIEWKPGVEYIAFSHVWSDGKGNPSGNSMPFCQIDDLCATMLSLSGSIGSFFPPITEQHDAPPVTTDPQAPTAPEGVITKYRFWIDTLCIPPEEGNRDLRRKAILRMKEVYANAWGVIVLDAELQKFSGKNKIEETLARIFSSLWMRRCWTLEELAMARRCYVRFSDALFDLRENVHPRREKWPVTCATTVDFDSNYHYLTRQFMDIIDVHHSQDPSMTEDEVKAENFARAWNCMSWRSTSQEGDRYVILAVLLGLDVSVVLSSSDIQQRIRALLASQHAIPMAIFTLNSHKQQVPGYRWAPTEFSTNALDIKPNEWKGLGLLDSKGLNVVTGGIMILHPIKYHEFYAYKDPVLKKWYMVHHQALPDDPGLEWLKGHSHEALMCFIFDVGPACGARLSLLSKEGGVYSVRYDCRVGVIEMAADHLPQDDGNMDPRKTPGIGFGFAKTFIPIVAVEKTSPTQKWCIQ